MICFAWKGFPQYAARCVGAFVRATKERVVVVATRPSVPIEGMEELSQCDVLWLEPNDGRPLKDVVGGMPRAIIASGWYVPAFLRFCKEVRDCGGMAIAMSDNNFNMSLRELVKALRFRLFISRMFDGYLVPGNSGVRLMRFYGADENRLSKGMYSADGSLFSQGKPLTERDRSIVYVGQFIERKNVRRLVKAFNRAIGVNKDGWRLKLYGCGPLKDELVANAGSWVEINDFLQPEQLSAVYKSARVFCLPSFEEHWGLVVHEAALSGCLLLLSDRVGSAEDFLGEHNGFLFSPFDESDIISKLKCAISLSDEALVQAESESLRLGRQISVNSFIEGVRGLIQ